MMSIQSEPGAPRRLSDLLSAGEPLEPPPPTTVGAAPLAVTPPSAPPRRPTLDHVALAGRAERVIRSQTPVFFASRRNHGDPSRLPLYLVGLASPTAKRVRAILSAHSRIHAARPLSLVPALLDTLEAWDRHCGRTRSFPESLEGLSADDSLKTAQWVLTRLQSEAPGADHILDGQALDAALVGFVHLIFPRAPLIVCVDDTGAGDPAEASEERRRMRLSHQKLVEHWRAVLPGRLIEVRRDALLAHPHDTVAALMARLELPLEERVIHAITAPPDGMQPGASPGAAIGTAVAQIRAGRLVQAEETVRGVLRQVPAHPAAVHLLGVIRFRQGEPAAAVHLMRQSLDLIGTPVREWQHNLAVARKALAGPGDGQGAASSPPPPSPPLPSTPPSPPPAATSSPPGGGPVKPPPMASSSPMAPPPSPPPSPPLGPPAAGRSSRPVEEAGEAL